MGNISSSTLFYGFVIGTIIYASYFWLTIPVCNLNIFFIDERQKKTRLDIVLLHAKESGFIPLALLQTILEESDYQNAKIVGFRSIYSRGFYPQLMFRKSGKVVKFLRK